MVSSLLVAFVVFGVVVLPLLVWVGVAALREARLRNTPLTEDEMRVLLD